MTKNICAENFDGLEENFELTSGNSTRVIRAVSKSES